MNEFGKTLLLTISFFISTAAIGQTISTTAGSYGPYCNGAVQEIEVYFTADGVFTGNYYIQLSDDNGGFTNDVTSSLISQASASSPVTAVIPANLSEGNYRVRVVNDAPAVYSNDDNGSDIVITAIPAAPVVSASDNTVCANDIVQLSIESQQSFIFGEENLTTVPNSYGPDLAPNPFQDFYGGCKQQMIFLPSELLAEGLSAGSAINSLSINLAAINASYSLLNLKVKIGHSNITGYATLSSWVPGLETVVNLESYSPVLGANLLSFDTAFVWDGTSSLIVEISYSNDAFNISGENSAFYSATSFPSTLFFMLDDVDPVTMENYSDDAVFLLNNRTNVVFGVAGPEYTWLPVENLFADALATIPYVEGTSAAVVYAKPQEDIVYTATTNAASGCTSASQTEIRVVKTWTGSLNTDWFTVDNWCGSIVPTAQDKVVIPATLNQPVISGAITANAASLDVEAGAQLTVQTNSTLNVKGSIIVDPMANVIVQNNSSLIQQDNAVNTGNITVNKNSNTLYKLDYTCWSSPVTGQNLQDFSPATLSNRFYIYGINAQGNEAYISTNTAGNFTPGTGYLIRMPNELDESDPNFEDYNNGDYSFAFEGQFTGIPNNGDVQVPLSTQQNFYTLVGNPYPSPISVEAFFEANEDVLFSGQGIYFWRKRNNATATSYATLTTIAYAANDGGLESEETPGTYTQGGQQWEEYFESSPSTWVIAPGQGFFVRGSGSVGHATFTNSMRRATVEGQPFFRTGSNNQPDLSRLWLNLGNGANFSQAAIAYTADATLGVDYGKDARNFSSSAISLYTLADQDKFTIQARPAFEASDIVPLGYTTATAGNYTIKLHRKDGIFDEGQEVYLKDNLLGVTYNLLEVYAFTTDAGTFNDRFEVVYMNNELGTENPPHYANTVVVYKQENLLKVNTGNSTIQDIRVYDLRGRLLYSSEAVNAANAVLTGLEPQGQLLVVKVTTESGTVNKKVIY